MSKVVTKKILKGKIEKIWADQPSPRANFSINLPQGDYQKYFPQVSFFVENDRGGQYWGNCNLNWLQNQFKEKLSEHQRFEIRIMSDDSLRYKATKPNF